MKIFFQITLALLLSYFTFQLFAADSYPWIFLDNVNLLIHEAGHLIVGLFNGFGSPIFTIFAGTLFQLSMPIVFGDYFFLRREMNGVIFCLFWLGDSLINIGVYMKDAVDQLLPLVGNDVVHDWQYIFSHYQQLLNAQIYGNTTMFLGYALVSLATLTAFGVVIIEALRTNSSPPPRRC